MLEQLKEIKEKLNDLIQEVERLENSIHGEKIIHEKKDFKFIKRLGTRNNPPRQVFQYLNQVIFQLHSSENAYSASKYETSIFNKLIDGTLERLILLKKASSLTNDGFTISHQVEEELDTKLRDAYRKNLESFK
jgi:hypothetical protein